MNIKKYKNYLFLLPFIFLFLILLNWHHSIGLSIDDLFFYTIPQETNIMSFVIERYDITDDWAKEQVPVRNDKENKE